MPFKFDITVSACVVLASIASGSGIEDGLTLFNTLQGPQSNRTTLIDNAGNIVHEWFCSSTVSSTPYLLPGGELVRPSQSPGKIYLDGAAWGG